LRPAVDAEAVLDCCGVTLRLPRARMRPVDDDVVVGRQALRDDAQAIDDRPER